MRACIVTGHGGVEKIEFRNDIPKPVPSDGEVVVRVISSSINHHDIFTRRGMEGIRIQFPLVTGSDIAGEVTELGPGVSQWCVGDRVLIDPVQFADGKFSMLGETVDGGKAEFVVAAVQQLLRLPENVSFDAASALPLAYGTAHRMLHTVGDILPGQTILVLGASGGVGVACVQLAKLAGASVIACAGSDEKVKRLLELGVDHALNYKTRNMREAVWDIVGKPGISGKGGVNVAVNFTGGETWPETIKCLRRHGRILTCGATAGHDVVSDLRYIWTFEHQIRGSTGWERSDLESLIKLIENGQLVPVIDQFFSLEDVAHAEKLMEERKVFGKIIVKPQQ